MCWQLGEAVFCCLLISFEVSQRSLSLVLVVGKGPPPSQMCWHSSLMPCLLPRSSPASFLLPLPSRLQETFVKGQLWGSFVSACALPPLSLNLMALEASMTAARSEKQHSRDYPRSEPPVVQLVQILGSHAVSAT